MEVINKNQFGNNGVKNINEYGRSNTGNVGAGFFGVHDRSDVERRSRNKKV